MAVGMGNGMISVTEAGLKNSQLQPLPVTMGSARVTIQ
jgi:hypothetical protein